MAWKRETIKGTHYTSVSYAVPRHARPAVWAGKTENGWSAQFAYGEGGYYVGGMKTRDQALSELLKLRDANQSQ